MRSNMPEPSLNPPEYPEYTASCGHEIVGTDDLEMMRGESGGGYLWDGKIICPDCAADKFDELNLKEKLALVGAEFITRDELLKGGYA